MSGAIKVTDYEMWVKFSATGMIKISSLRSLAAFKRAQEPLDNSKHWTSLTALS